MKSVKPVSDAITAPVLLLVEGQDEEYLVQRMCEQWFGVRAQKIDIECVDGRDNFLSHHFHHCFPLPPVFSYFSMKSL